MGIDPISIITKIAVQFIVSKVFAKKEAKRFAGGGPNQNSGIVVNKNSSNDPIPVVYGRRRIGGTRAFVGSSNGSGGSGTNNLNMVLVLCEGEVGAPMKVFFNDTLIWHSSSDNVSDRGSGTTNTLGSGGLELANYETTKYGSHYIAFYPGSDTQTVDTTLQTSIGSGTWTSTRTLTGLAYLAMKLPVDADYNGAVPEVTVEFAGKLIRFATNPIGAAPSNNDPLGNQNPADVMLDYLTNSRYGKSLADTDIDLVSFAAARAYFNLASSSESAPKFRVNGFLNTDQTMFNNVEEITEMCNAMLIYDKGLYKLKHRAQNESSTFSFTRDTIVGDIDIQLPPKSVKFNKFEVTFGNKANEYNDDVDFTNSDTYLTEDNNTVLVGRTSNTLISTNSQASQLGKYLMDDSRHQTVINFKAPHSAIDVSAGDVVDVTHTDLGFSSKKFRILSATLNEDDTIDFQAQVYESSIQV
tara:strand:+ start:11497 stop:12903 length:1407 start_codon:yes stop_codon:yes gene_type:complete